MKELIILIAWHKESNEDRVHAFQENKKSFADHNPDVDIITVMTPFEGMEAWLNTDLSCFKWYLENGHMHSAQRYLIVEWDCWCNCDMYAYYKRVWDCDIVVPGIKYPERDDWYWFSTIDKLPERVRKYTTGVVPFCGILLSNFAMKKVSQEILKPEYYGLNSELRFGTVATSLGLDPIVNPVCNRTISWSGISPLDSNYLGLHHPKKLT
ncbi:hypothetical protein [Pedobacter sp. JY14-1]|uniref:hypothetical protein n=1 Tax=Pedobacter sp. JY14-1 TaxID=3034151 RepID=UPI0023E2BB8D|nr:hypothetical protein [Pedobacter sp. JY14-1]